MHQRRRKPKGEWLWELIAALKRGRPEPETPPGEEGTAAAAQWLLDALAVPVDAGREARSRERLLAQLEAEPRQPRRLPAPAGAHGPVGWLGEEIVPLAAVLTLILVGWVLFPRGAGAARARAYRVDADRLCASRLYLGSLHAAASDPLLRGEFGGAQGLLRPH